jgi:hypothetical protein
MPKHRIIPSLLAICAIMTAAMPCSLYAQAPDATEDIRGPKAMVEIPVPPKSPVAWWAGIAGGVAVIALSTYFWRKHSRKKTVPRPSAIALKSLMELANTRDSLAADAFAERAAQLVRNYIEAQFGIAAPRRTTEEFLRDLNEKNQLSLIQQNQTLQPFLKSCDLAKFAGANLDFHRREELIETAREFVRSTSITPTS